MSVFILWNMEGMVGGEKKGLNENYYSCVLWTTSPRGTDARGGDFERRRNHATAAAVVAGKNFYSLALGSDENVSRS